MCDHLKSTQFIGTSVAEDYLKEEALDFVIETFKWLKPERKSQCLEWQRKATLQNATLVVQIPAMADVSNCFLHFSVFGNIKRDHYWSFCKCVVVSFDKESSSFHCKCCPSRRSCMYKCIIKWAIAQWQPWVLGKSVSTNANEDIGEVLSGGVHLGDCEQLEEDGEVGDNHPDPCSTFYPPVGDVAVKFVKYLLNEKKIPANLPLALTVQKESFKKR